MKNVFELATNTVSKNLIVFKVFSRKVFEFYLRHWVLGFGASFILMLLMHHQSAKKQGSKKDFVKSVELNGLKIIFTLLAKATAIKI